MNEFSFIVFVQAPPAPTFYKLYTQIQKRVDHAVNPFLYL